MISALGQAIDLIFPILPCGTLLTECSLVILVTIPDSKVHGANMGHILGRQDPDGPHVGPMNLAIWDLYTNAPIFFGNSDYVVKYIFH